MIRGSGWIVLRSRRQPREDLRQPNFEGINVPGRNPHYLAAAGGVGSGLAPGGVAAGGLVPGFTPVAEVG